MLLLRATRRVATPGAAPDLPEGVEMLDVAMAEYVVAVRREPFSVSTTRRAETNRMSGWEMSRNDQCVAGPARAARREWHRPGCRREPRRSGARDRGRPRDVGLQCGPQRRR